MNPAHVQRVIERALRAIALSTTAPSPRGGIRVSGGKDSIPTPIPEDVLSGKEELHQHLHGWARAFSEDGGFVLDSDPDDISVLSWLHTKAGYISSHPAAYDFVEELSADIRLIESPYTPKVKTTTFLGIHGGDEIHVRDGQDTVELADGRVERVESVKAWNRDQVLFYEGTAKEVAEMIWEFFGEYINPQKIAIARKNDAAPRCKKTARLEAVRRDGGKFIYRVFDVLEHLGEKDSHRQLTQPGQVL